MAAGFIFAALFAVSASAQTGAQSAAGQKIAVINTAAFDDAKDGIKKYTTALSALENEMKPLSTEIDGLVARYNTLGSDIKRLQDQAAKGGAGSVPIDTTAAQKKVEEYQALELTIKRKQEDGKRKVELRQPQILGPVLQDIGKAMDEFAKQKGLSMILDISKDQTGLILTIDAAKVDITREFITFYNARPSGTASTAVPQ